MPKVTEEYLDTRKQQIIDAAYRCFSRKGLHQTTMRDIYAESGLSAGAVYRYFKSKEDIIEASFRFDYQRSLPAFERAAEEKADPLESIQRLVEFFFTGVESAAETGALGANIQGWGEAMVNPCLRAPLQSFLDDFRGLVEKLVERGITAGKVDPGVDATAAAELILSTFLGLYLQKAMDADLAVGRYQVTVSHLLRCTFGRQNISPP
jgi:AcrR family transcriptional regulator